MQCNCHGYLIPKASDVTDKEQVHNLGVLPEPSLSLMVQVSKYSGLEFAHWLQPCLERGTLARVVQATLECTLYRTVLEMTWMLQPHAICSS